MSTGNKFDVAHHFETLRKAAYWTDWFFLPHGTDKDPRVLLRAKAIGIVYYDRELAFGEREKAV